MKKIIIISLIALALLLAMGIYGTQLAWGDDVNKISFSALPDYSREGVESALQISLSEKEEITQIEKIADHIGNTRYTVAIKSGDVLTFVKSNEIFTILPKVSEKEIKAGGYYIKGNMLYITLWQLNYDNENSLYSDYGDYAKNLINALEAALECDDGIRPKQYHLDEEYGFVTDISKAEQTEILDILNIAIPENETEAFIAAFGKKEDKSYKNGCFTFVVEIGGVKDYKTFFEVNPDIKSLNQAYGNQIYEEEKLGTAYFITYIKHYSYLSQQDIKSVDKLCKIFNSSSNNGR